jgi:hypothetical protein
MVGMIATLIADPEPRDPAATWPRIRVSRPPRIEGPYDDEGDPLPAGLVHAPSEAGGDQPHRPPVDDAVTDSSSPSDRPSSTPTSTRAALAYVRLCIEVLNGYRPPSHLRRVGGPVEFADVIDQFRRRQNGRGRTGPTVGPRTTAPASVANTIPTQRLAGQHSGYTTNMATVPDQASINATTRANATVRANPTARPNLASGTGKSNVSARWAPVSLVRLRVSEPLDGVAEAVAVLAHAGASCAMALRLERIAGTWTCAFAQVI